MTIGTKSDSKYLKRVKTLVLRVLIFWEIWEFKVYKGWLLKDINKPSIN